MLGFAVMPDGLEASIQQLVDEDLQRHAVLQADARR